MAEDRGSPEAGDMAERLRLFTDWLECFHTAECDLVPDNGTLLLTDKAGGSQVGEYLFSSDAAAEDAEDWCLERFRAISALLAGTSDYRQSVMALLGSLEGDARAHERKAAAQMRVAPESGDRFARLAERYRSAAVVVRSCLSERPRA